MVGKITKALVTLAATTTLATTAYAGGLERSTFSNAILFEEGTYLEGSFAYISPDVTSDNGLFDINPAYSQYYLAFKADLHERVAVAFSTYEPAGADIAYGAPVNLAVDINTRAYTLVGKVDVANGFSVFGGAAYYTAKASTNNLLAAGGIPGGITHGTDGAFGWIGGVAYERPEIALRVSLTYESGADLELPTTFAAIPGLTATTFAAIPEAWTLNFQTGIAPKTLLFGGVRHVRHDGGNISIAPLPVVGRANITDFSNTTAYTLGLGREFTEKWSGNVSLTYEASDGSPSDFAPTGDKYTLAIGARFKATEKLTISSGISHTWLGAGSSNRIGPFPFSDNSAWAAGTRVGYRF